MPRRWPAVLETVALLGVVVATVSLSIQVRALRRENRLLDLRLRGIEERSPAEVATVPRGQIGTPEIHVDPPAYDPELSRRIEEIERRLGPARPDPRDREGH